MKTEKAAIKIMETIQALISNPKAVDAIVKKHRESEKMSAEFLQEKADAQKIIDTAKTVQAEIKKGQNALAAGQEKLKVDLELFGKQKSSFVEGLDAFTKEQADFQKSVTDFNARNQKLVKAEEQFRKRSEEQAERSKAIDADRAALDAQKEKFKKAHAMVA